ncbi:MAG: hydroxymethylglutaryl-CoA lyase [Burkholderiales bacterium]|nr:MAG: hydroxymethylglutaryl-CoA lyase [Burkholderiales bacterium]
MPNGSSEAAAGLGLPQRVELVDVGPRDGLQTLSQTIPTEHKIELIEAIVDAGIRSVEAVSFAHPRVLPQLADAEAVMTGLRRREGVVYRGLVPNLRGAHRALGCGVDEMVCLVSCDDDLNLRNQGMDVEATLAQIEQTTELARAQARSVSVVIALAFFMLGKGPTPFERLRAICRRLAGFGVERLTLAASVGMADPRQVFETVCRLRAELPRVQFGLHLHNRNGMALANAFAGLLAGVSWLEGSILGVGGDAWFPADDVTVLGNVPMEDLVQMTELIGVETGVDLQRYLQASRLAESILGQRSASFLVRGGTRAMLASARWD